MKYDLAQERTWFPKIREMSDADAEIWLDNLYCCACMGCPTCEHDCHLSEEKRAENVAFHDEGVRDMFTRKGGDVWQNSRGQWMRCTESANPAGEPCTIIDYLPEEDIPP